MWLCKLGKEGCVIPKGYGVSYYKGSQDCTVLYPIPLNHIVSFIRSIYYKLRSSYFCNWLDGQILYAYSKGFRNGKKSNRAKIYDAYAEGCFDGGKQSDLGYKNKLTDAYNSGYRDAELDKDQKEEKNGNPSLCDSDCNSCTIEPHPICYYPSR